jgi:peroxiredoxin
MRRLSRFSTVDIFNHPIRLGCVNMLLKMPLVQLLLAVVAWAQTSLPPTDLSPTDLSRVVAGTVAPDFQLPSSAGGTLKLSSLRGKNVVLVFYRGYWCAYCVKQMVELQSLLPDSHRKDTLIVGVSPDPMDELKLVIPRVTERAGGTFLVTLLSDAGHKVIDLYGLRNVEPDAEAPFLPYPTTYVIDAAGKVRWRFTEKNQAVRPSNEMILAEVKKLW